MRRNSRVRSKTWLLVGGAGVVLGSLAALTCLAPLLQGKTKAAEASVQSAEVKPAPGSAPGENGSMRIDASSSAAMRYARAVEDGDIDEIMRMVRWVSERQERIALDTNDANRREAEREELARRLLERKVEGNLLLPEGIEDQYIFVPGATLEFVSVDKGREGLERAVKERMWIRVTYPNQSRAPMSLAGHAIRSVAVGVNVDDEGSVLKAGIVGNLDIDVGSIEYWALPQGG